MTNIYIIINIEQQTAKNLKNVNTQYTIEAHNYNNN